MNKIGYPAKGSKREAEWIWNNHKNEFKPRKQSSISLLQWCIENWDENGERVYQEWDKEANEIKIWEVTSGSNKKFWWKCEKGHEWEATVCNRSSHGRGCPYCAGQRLILGVNDLKTLYPDLAKEWNYEKNKILPPEVSFGSGKKVWWKCEKGHEWEASICNRNKGKGCPYCSNQKILSGYNDLLTTNPKLASEWNYEKNNILPSAVAPGSNKKIWWKCSKGHEWEAAVSDRANGNGCPYCGNKSVLVGYNDLQTLNPRLVAEWNYEKNDVLPSEVMCKSGKKVWWRCERGHEWKAVINSRSSGCGCPYCIGKKIWMGDSNADDWSIKHQYAKEYYVTNNHLKVPQRYVVDNFKLGIWIHTQRKAYKKGTLSAERIQKLEEIGMEW